MNKWWLIFPIILCVIACSEPKKENQFVTFSGHIKNAKLDSVYIILNEREKGFALDFDGNFSDTVQLNDEGYKTLSIDREEFSMYLIPGDSLHLRVDLHKFDDTFVFNGTGAARNNYLFLKENLVNNWLANELVFRLDPKEYQENLADFLHHLKLEMAENGVDKSFIKIETKNLYFDECNLLYAYRDSYPYFNPQKTQLPIDFINFSNYNLDHEEDFKQFKSYRNIVTYYLDEQLNRGLSANDILESTKSESIRYAFMRTLIDGLDPADSMSVAYYDAIVKHCKYQPWLDEAKVIMTNKKVK